MTADADRPLILVADDDDLFTDDVIAILEPHYRTLAIHDPDAVRATVASERPDAVLLDLDFGQGRSNGFAVLESLGDLRDASPVIMLSGRDDLEAVVRSVKSGAFHYLQKDPDPDELLNLLARCLEESDLRRRLRALQHEADRHRDDYVAADPASRAVLAEIRRVAPTLATVLITGPTGAGKELAAKEIHRLSARAARPFVVMNCAAGAPDLIESELFGHLRGSFTGATNLRDGLIATARGGTLFLDEIGDASPDLQQKLLRVIEERTYRPVGADHEQQADVRLIAATRRDLEADVARGRFREDLYFRLAVLRLHLPPLADRRGDILPLAEAMLARLAGECGRPVLGFTDEAAAWLRQQDWPGNARELRNVVERAVIRCSGERCGLGDVIGGWPGQAPVLEPYKEAKERAVRAFQLPYVVSQLERNEGNISRAAEASGLSRQAFSRLCRELGVGEEDQE